MDENKKVELNDDLLEQASGGNGVDEEEAVKGLVDLVDSGFAEDAR